MEINYIGLVIQEANEFLSEIITRNVYQENR